MANITSNSLCHRAQSTAKRWSKLVLPAAIVLFALSACMKDDIDDCPGNTPSKVSLSFDYTYNVKEADAFAAEVKNINVFAFDANGKFYDSYTQSAEKFETGHTMDISGLQDGKYTFVCLARDRQTTTKAIGDDEMEFTFPSLTPGVSTIDDLTEKMGNSDGSTPLENNKEFAALYTAQASVDFKSLTSDGKTGNIVADTLSLMKCTKTYRIVLLPYENDQVDFEPENFDVRIEGSAAWLDHKGDKVRNELITYLPFNTELRQNYGDEKTLVDAKPVDQALVYDMMSSRMFERATGKTDEAEAVYSDKRIIITDKRDPQNPKEVFNHSLPWFLALCGEHADKDWEDQEYLDRQDHYVLMFYVPDTRNYNMSARVKINGWVLNQIDTPLGQQ